MTTQSRAERAAEVEALDVTAAGFETEFERYSAQGLRPGREWTAAAEEADRALSEHAPAMAALIAEYAAAEQELLARVAELEKAREWQPIETAPKDGTLILIKDEWGIHQAQNVALTDGPEDDFWNDGWGNLSENPTHWMPLPEPPK